MGKISTFQKALGCIVALFLLAGTVPIGLFYFSEPVIAEGSVVRLSPSCETFVYSGAANKNKSRLDDDVLIVGNYWNTYLKFDLSVLGNVKKSDVTAAKLRLAVLWNGTYDGEHNDCTFNVSFVDNNNWNENMTWQSKPSGEEQYLCTASGADPYSLLEIDITEFLRQAVTYDDTTITLKLSPSVSNDSPIYIAPTTDSDPTYRPYLKILVGDAYDNDTDVLEKSYLDADGYVSEAAPNTSSRELLAKNNGMLVADNGSAAYIRFGLRLENIAGVAEDARLELRMANKSTSAEFDVYLLENNDWTSDTLSFASRPTGEKTLIESFRGVNRGGWLSIDVTDLVYDAVSRGETYLTFMIDGTEKAPESTESLSLYSSYFDGLAPRLSISSTDDKSVTALMEALTNLSGSNSSFDNVTSDLPSGYTADNGERVTIRWDSSTDFSLETLLWLRKTAVTNTGHINQPAIFEDPLTVRVRAELSCGDKGLTRFIVMTVMPEFGVPNRLTPLIKAVE